MTSYIYLPPGLGTPRYTASGTARLIQNTLAAAYIAFVRIEVAVVL